MYNSRVVGCFQVILCCDEKICMALKPVHMYVYSLIGVATEERCVCVFECVCVCVCVCEYVFECVETTFF